MKRQSKKKWCYEYIEPIAKAWKLNPTQISSVQSAFYKEMGGYGKKPNIMKPDEHSKVVRTTNDFVSRIRKNMKSYANNS